MLAVVLVQGLTPRWWMSMVGLPRRLWFDVRDFCIRIVGVKEKQTHLGCVPDAWPSTTPAVRQSVVMQWLWPGQGDQPVLSMRA